MDKVTVNQLAEEFKLDSKTILKELKKIGVMVFSANQPIDPRFVGKVTAHLKLLSNLAEEEVKRAERKRQVTKKRTTRPKQKRVEPPSIEGAISTDMTIRKAKKVEPEPEEDVMEVTAEEATEMAAEEAVEAVDVGAAGQVQVDESEEVTLEAKVTVAPAEPEKVEETREKEDAALPPRKAREEEEEVPGRRKKAAKKAARSKALEKDIDEYLLGEEEAEPLAFEEKEEKKEKPAPIIREVKKEKKKAKVLKKSAAARPASDESLTRGLGLFAPQDARRKKKRRRPRAAVAEQKVEKKRERPKDLKKISIPEGLTVKEVAERMDIPPKDILKNLFMRGVVVNINQILDTDVVREIGLELGFEVEEISYEEELMDAEILDAESGDYMPRPPVITVMGHVDHGKTSLLDAVRNTMVAEGEAGGITQHIGAYQVTVNDRKVTFIDTPGHEAFTMMRARGAKVTDIVILVVAADDGVMPQTVEAIQHARAANVPIIVAINKIDKPNANPDKVKQDLSALELVPEQWGGSTVFVEVSAKKATNIDQMLEMVLLVADMLELQAIPHTKASGTVIESRLDKTRGPVATLLVQHGTLFERDIIVSGATTGKIRAMYDEKNTRLDQAEPSSPVLVMGLDNVLEAGERFFATDDATKARQLSVYRQEKQREEILSKMDNRVSLDKLFQQLQEGQIKELPIILKVDVQGSKDAIESMLNKQSTEKVKITIMHSAVGPIHENDVLLASASNAIIVGFNVKPVKSAEELAKREHVDIRFYNVIYNIADEIRKAMEGLLDYTEKENVIGTVEVRDTFRVPGAGTVIGGYVTDGHVRRDARGRLFRDGVKIYEGRISSLRRFKEDVTEVKSGYECGLGLENYNDIKVGDELQVFTVEKVKDTLES